MDIVGKTVFHRNLNNKTNHKGMIIAVKRDGSSFDITFEEDTEPYRNFSVPQAFVSTNGSPAFLFSVDEELNAWLDSAKKQHLCTECGNRSNKLEQYDDMKLCPQCLSELVTCQQCKKKLVKSKARKDLWYDFYLCDNCFDSTHCTCSICGKLRKTNSIVRGHFIPSDHIICNHCADDVITFCDECSEPCPNEQIKSIDGYSYCSECYSVKTGICNICKEQSADLKNGMCYSCRAKKSYSDYFCDSAFLKRNALRIHGDRDNMRELHTTRLMSRLNKSCSENPFDILILQGYIRYNGRYLDLIIVPEIPYPGYNTLPFSCTMTEFKMDNGYRIRRTIESALEDKQSASIKLDDTHNFILMHKAYVLNAKTYRDMNYGDRWYGRYHCEEGNKYGDMSSFYVVGAIESTDAKSILGGYVYFHD